MIHTRSGRVVVATFALTCILGAGAVPAAGLDNATCLGCHGVEGFAMPGADGQARALHVTRERFEGSVHGKLTCTTCHQAITEVPHKPGPRPKVDCGMCHSAQKADYLKSVHGDEAVWKLNPRAATCASCHTAHYVASPKTDAAKLAIIESCGTCHKENFRSFLDTYHGQITSLGYTYTAKCSDCHGSHGIQRAHDPSSTVHQDNRLATCQKCHANATPGFVTFQPHANTRDYGRYPFMWIASKFMIALLAGVFAFFWTHSALWFYREYRDRREGKSAPHVATGDLAPLRGKHIRRFALGWRVAHLVFALSVMTLVLTGMAVLYSETGWAKLVVGALGGPQVAGVLHRASAAIMLGIFFVHLVYIAIRVLPGWKLSDWFGPTSLVPNWKDLADAIAMFKWFFGKGRRPALSRWTYWEKFDYWAVFWGMAIIGGSGLMLAYKELTASVLPGWAFNIATLVHGEEAILAAVFLFTVHFFNNHFRPDKLPPPDIVMFTGAVPLEEFRREHALEYQRLVETGQLEKHLVDAPSRAMTLGSRILGLVLLAVGLVLLALVLIGFVGDLRAG